MKAILTALALVAASSPALAQTQIPAFQTDYQGVIQPATTVDPGAFIGATCLSAEKVAEQEGLYPGNDYSNQQCGRDVAGNVNVTQYIRVSDIADAAVNAARQDMMAWGHLQNRNLRQGLALTGALDIQAPAEGRSNRLGMSSAAYDGKLAVGLSYSRRENDIDFGAGMSFSDEKMMGKLSAGWSW